ncbi:MAG: hypothetical protein AAF787_00255 [Chloroflexota bacterium]
MVTFPPEMSELINEAQFLLITGWTHDEYEATPVDVRDAVWQVHQAQQDIKQWQQQQAAKKAKARRRGR